MPGPHHSRSAGPCRSGRPLVLRDRDSAWAGRFRPNPSKTGEPNDKLVRAQWRTLARRSGRRPSPDRRSMEGARSCGRHVAAETAPKLPSCMKNAGPRGAGAVSGGHAPLDEGLKGGGLFARRSGMPFLCRSTLGRSTGAQRARKAPRRTRRRALASRPRGPLGATGLSRETRARSRQAAVSPDSRGPTASRPARTLRPACRGGARRRRPPRLRPRPRPRRPTPPRRRR